MAFPVSVHVDLPVGPRNRLTTLLRALLALPHSLLVGPVYFSSKTGGNGLIAGAAYLMAVVGWFTILITGTHPAGIRDFCLYYLRWRTRALAYMALFADAYPPFGDGPYPAGIDVGALPDTRDRASIALRVVLAIPHFIALCVLGLGWFIATVIAWFAILLTGAYPASLWAFSVGVMRWCLRVEAYMLLLVDEYPPFSLDDVTPGPPA